MDPLSAGLTILVGFGSCDGLGNEETKIMSSYVKCLRKLGYSEKSIISQWDTIWQYDDEEFERVFLMSINYFKNNLSKEFKILMLECIMFMIISDAKDGLTETEDYYFSLCCELWEIDLNNYIGSFEEIMKQLIAKTQ